MGCSTIAKCIFILVNVLFVIIGLSFMVVGVILAFVPGQLPLSSLLDAINEGAMKISTTGVNKLLEPVDVFKELPMIYELSIALFVLGIILFSMGILGCCGSCCSCCDMMLIVFAIVMGALMVVEIVLVTMFFVPDSPLHEILRTALKKKILKYDDDPKTTDSFSVVINFLNYNFHCCGIEGTSDFKNNRTPMSCQTMNSFTTTTETTYYKEGCYTKLIQDNILYAGIAFAALLLFQLIQMIFAIAIYKKSNKVSPF